MARSRLPVFHVERQYAVRLLNPIENTLAELTARLQQYAGRMPLTDGDRDAIIAAAVEGAWPK